MEFKQCDGKCKKFFCMKEMDVASWVSMNSDYGMHKLGHDANAVNLLLQMNSIVQREI